MALKLKKTPGEINSLTAYHDLMRLKSVNKYLAKIYIIAGIRWVWHLKKHSISQVNQKIHRSRIGSTVQVQKDIISQTISEAKNTKIIISGLEKEIFFLQRKGYIITKSPSKWEIKPEDPKHNKEVILLILTIILLLLFSFVSLYFFTLIFIVLSLHILFQTQALSGISQQLWVLWIWQNTQKLWSIICLCIFSLILAIWFFTWSISLSIQKYFISQWSYEDNIRWKYFPQEIHSHYSQRDITREELIKILIVTLWVDLEKQIEIDCFKDSFQSKYPKEICYAKKQWFIQWDSLENFYPNNSISHAAGLKFILNFYWYRVPKESLYITFTDLQKRQWQTTYAEYAKRIWIISPSVTEFKPEKPITIDQIDEYLQKLSTK